MKLPPFFVDFEGNKVVISKLESFLTTLSRSYILVSKPLNCNPVFATCLSETIVVNINFEKISKSSIHFFYVLFTQRILNVGMIKYCPFLWKKPLKAFSATLSKHGHVLKLELKTADTYWEIVVFSYSVQMESKGRKGQDYTETFTYLIYTQRM